MISKQLDARLVMREHDAFRECGGDELQALERDLVHEHRARKIGIDRSAFRQLVRTLRRWFDARSLA